MLVFLIYYVIIVETELCCIFINVLSDFFS